MSSGKDFIKDIKEQIDYTHQLEKAYLEKHEEVEFLYKKLQEMVHFLKEDKFDYSRINKLIKNIQKIVSRQSDEEEEQLEVLENSKDILEDMETKIQGKSEVPDLINNLKKSIKKKSRRVPMGGGGRKSRKNLNKY